MKVIVNGVGAAGSSIIKMMYNYGFKNILAFDSKGVLHPDKKDSYNPLKQELLRIHQSAWRKPGGLEGGVSRRGCVYRRFQRATC